mmetsp:Transcript_9432/g.14461  ORF Transcript_9432/g.14461 Transcript_9432/m.14461 type:complete len:165 (-) Transcript_9432:27-521(-)
MHNHSKNDPSIRASAGIGVEGIDSKKAPAAHLSLVDDEARGHTLRLMVIFFIDFISAWFDQYTKYFAGERLEKVATSIEKVILSLFQSTAVFVVISTLAEVYVLSIYMRFHVEEFGGAKALFESGSLLFTAAIAGLLSKLLVNLIEIKHGVLRIVDFDIEEKVK